MARLRFPGRPGYRFDRIGVRYGADEASQTTDPTLAIVASIHRGLRHFKDLFGDSDEEEEEFHGFSANEVSAAEKKVRHAIREEQLLNEQRNEEFQERYERSQARLADYEAAGVFLPRASMKKTYQKLIASDLVTDARSKLVNRTNFVSEVADVVSGGVDVGKKGCSLKHIKLKRLTHNLESQGGMKKKKGRPRKMGYGSRPELNYEPAFERGEFAVSSSLFSSAKTSSRYGSAAQHILSKATKHAAQTSSNKVRKFVLPTKSSRSSRVIKPSKRLLEEDSVQSLVACKQAKFVAPTYIPSQAPTSTFSLSADDMNSTNSFSVFSGQGISLSPLTANREKGFPSFSSAPQPSGTMSFTDGLTASQRQMGLLDRPLIVEGKRPKKPSLIMRMKLVEDNVEDEILLQQQLSDAVSPGKPVSSYPNEEDHDEDDKPYEPSTSSPLLGKGFGLGKSLIAPAKLFTDSTKPSQPSGFFKHRRRNRFSLADSLPSQSTVVLRQAKLQLNRNAMNRSKAALAKSLKAQLKRERSMRMSEEETSESSSHTASSVTPSTLSQLSPFSQMSAIAEIDKQKSGLFEGMADGMGSFSPNGVAASPNTSGVPELPVRKANVKFDPQFKKRVDKECRRTMEELDRLRNERYHPGGKHPCLVCGTVCRVKRNRKLPMVPLCKPCKKFFFYQMSVNGGIPSRTKICSRYGCCVALCQPRQSMSSYCVACKFQKFNFACNFANSWTGETLLLSHSRPVTSTSTTPPAVRTPGKRKRNKSGSAHSVDFDFDDEDNHAAGSSQSRHSSGKTTKERSKHHSGGSDSRHELINARNLDKPLSVDVGQDHTLGNLSPPQTAASSTSSPSKSLRSPSTARRSSKSERDSDADLDNDSAQRSSRGPRIKHVCRRAAMVFPQQRATFPETAHATRVLTLSALPSEEKEQILARTKHHDSKRPTRLSSEEESSNDEAAVAEANCSPQKPALPVKQEVTTTKEKKSSSKKSYKKEKLASMKKRHRKEDKKRFWGEKRRNLLCAKRKVRCMKCQGCKASECGECINCKDKTKFGGPNKLRRVCVRQMCQEPHYTGKATAAFINPKSPEGDEDDMEPKGDHRDEDDDDDDDDDDNVGDSYVPFNRKQFINGVGPRGSSTRLSSKEPKKYKDLGGDGDMECADSDEEAVDSDSEKEEETSSQHSSKAEPPRRCGLDMDGSQIKPKNNSNNNNNNSRVSRSKFPKAGVEATVQLALADIRAPNLNSYVGKLGGVKGKDKLSRALAADLPLVSRETAYLSEIPLKSHLIRADYREGYDVEVAWYHGFSLTITGTSCVRTLCYLCGSAGKDELIFCIVCCQPYHSFCLEDDERPEDEGIEEDGDESANEDQHQHHQHQHQHSSSLTWCCRRCQFCNVCGQQNGLLKCHRCRDTYHPECLGPNYPTKPSKKKNIWVCTKCVRCKSCGATTPGVGNSATWTYDFSLCYECGKLMDKGNFCPVCHKCYSDDDWESKMIHCAICDSWVHAKCEELTDEMYQLLSCLPDDVQFKCRVCSPNKSAKWEKLLKMEFIKGLLNVFNCLMNSRCTRSLMEAAVAAPRNKAIKAKPLTNCVTTANSPPVGVNDSEIISPTVSNHTSSTETCPSPAQVCSDNDDNDHCDKESRSEHNNCAATFECSVNNLVEAPPSSDSQMPQVSHKPPEESNAVSAYSGLEEKSSVQDLILINENSESACSDNDSNVACDGSNSSHCLQSSSSNTSCSSAHQSSGSPVIVPIISSMAKSHFDSSEADGVTSKNACGSVPLDRSESPLPPRLVVGCRGDENAKSSDKCEELASKPAAACNSFENDEEDMEAENPSELTGLCEPAENGIVVKRTEDSKCGDDSLPHASCSSCRSAVSQEQEKYCDSSATSSSCANCSKLSSCPQPLTPSMQKQSSPKDQSHSNDRVSSVREKSTSSFSSSSCPSSEYAGCNGFAGHAAPSPNASSPLPSSCKSGASSTFNAHSHCDSSNDCHNNPHPNMIIPSSHNHGQSGSTYGHRGNALNATFDSLLPSSSGDCPRLGPSAEQPNGDDSSETNESNGSHFDSGAAAFDKDPQRIVCDVKSDAGGGNSLCKLNEGIVSAPSTVSDGATPSVESASAAAASDDLVPSKATALKVKGANGDHKEAREHVSFTSLSPAIHADEKNENNPRDFHAVRLKIDSSVYNSVEEFSEDMVRIIQCSLTEHQTTFSRRKQANSMRSIFIKQMERNFPWFNVNTCKLWEHNQGLPEGMLKEAVLPPYSDHTYAQWLERQSIPMSPQPSPFKHIRSPAWPSSGEDLSPNDSSRMLESGGGLTATSHSSQEDARYCLLCGVYGDGLAQESGRLLYCGQNEWIHIHCALWSAEVFEANDGSLQNVHDTISRGKKLRCNLCSQVGATVGCCEANCPANYHFMCAREAKCVFQEDTRMFCRQHADCVEAEIVKGRRFETQRRVCVDIDRVRNKSWNKAVDPSFLSVLFGSCTIEQLGELKPSLSDTEDCLLPIGFTCTKIYWSTQDARRRCVYTCRIIELKPETEASEMRIKDIRVVHDQDHPDFVPYHRLNLDDYCIPNFTLLHNFNPPALPESLETNNQQELACLGTGGGDGVLSLPTSNVFKPKVKPMDLTGLSPSTLALLNIKDPKSYIPPGVNANGARNKGAGGKPSSSGDNEELGLVKIANRLNRAASTGPAGDAAPVRKRSSSMEKLSVDLQSPSLMPTTGKYVRKHNVKQSKSLTTSPIMFQAGNSGALSQRLPGPDMSPTSTVWRVSTSDFRSLVFRPRCESPSRKIVKRYEFVPGRHTRSVSLSPPVTTSTPANFNFQKRSIIASSSLSDDPSSPLAAKENFRSALVSNPIVELSEGEDDETMMDENACKTPASDLLPPQSSQEGGHSQLSPECIQSILKNVPQDILDGEDEVKVVLLTDTSEDMSEEDLISMASAALGEAKSSEGDGEAEGSGGGNGSGDNNSGGDDDENETSGGTASTAPSNSESGSQMVNQSIVPASGSNGERIEGDECVKDGRVDSGYDQCGEASHHEKEDGKNNDDVDGNFEKEELRSDWEDAKVVSAESVRLGPDSKDCSLSNASAVSSLVPGVSEQSEEGEEDDDDEDGNARRRRDDRCPSENNPYDLSCSKDKEEDNEEDMDDDDDDHGCSQEETDAFVGNQAHVSSMSKVAGTPLSNSPPPQSPSDDKDGCIGATSFGEQHAAEANSSLSDVEADKKDLSFSFSSDVEQPREKDSPLASVPRDGDNALGASIVEIEASVGEGTSVSGVDLEEEQELLFGLEEEEPATSGSIADGFDLGNESALLITAAENEKSCEDDANSTPVCCPGRGIENQASDGDVNDNDLSVGFVKPIVTPKENGDASSSNHVFLCQTSAIRSEETDENGDRPRLPGCELFPNSEKGEETYVSPSGQLSDSCNELREHDLCKDNIPPHVAGEGEKRDLTSKDKPVAVTTDEESDYLVLEDLSFDDTHDEDGNECERKGPEDSARKVDTVKQGSRESGSISPDADPQMAKPFEDDTPKPEGVEGHSPQSEKGEGHVPQKGKVASISGFPMSERKSANQDGKVAIDASCEEDSHAHTTCGRSNQEPLSDDLSNQSSIFLDDDLQKSHSVMDANNLSTQKKTSHQTMAASNESFENPSLREVENFERNKKRGEVEGVTDMEFVAHNNATEDVHAVMEECGGEEIENEDLTGIERQEAKREDVSEASDSSVGKKTVPENQMKVLKEYPLRRRRSRQFDEVKRSSVSDSEAIGQNVWPLSNDAKYSTSDYEGRSRKGRDNRRRLEARKSLVGGKEGSGLTGNVEEVENFVVARVDDDVSLKSRVTNDDRDTVASSDKCDDIEPNFPNLPESVTQNQGVVKEISEHGTNAPKTDDDDVFPADEDKESVLPEEMIEKNSPQGKGPHKCPTCKRLYKTFDSYNSHIRICDFEVSTSEDDDVGEPGSSRSTPRTAKDPSDFERSVREEPIGKLSQQQEASGASVDVREQLSIIITDDFSSPLGRDLSDDGSSDSRRSLRRSTLTQRNVAPAHLAKVRMRDSKSTASPDSTCSPSLLSPRSRLEEKVSPKETMLEAVGLVSRRSLDAAISPMGSEFDASVGSGAAGGGVGGVGGVGDSIASRTRTMKLQPRVSPTTMAVVPKRERKSPAQASVSGTKMSIMAGGVKKEEAGTDAEKGVRIVFPIVDHEIQMRQARRQKRPKRVWYVEESESSEEEATAAAAGDAEIPKAGEEEREDDERGVAGRTRHSRMRVSHESKPVDDGKKLKPGLDSPADNDCLDTPGCSLKEEVDAETKPQATDEVLESDMKIDGTEDIMESGKIGRRSSLRSSLSTSADRVKREDRAAVKADPDEQHFEGKDEVDAAVSSSRSDTMMEYGDEAVKGHESERLADDGEDFSPTTVRRSRRPSNKTAKLNQYLADLKGEKEEGEFETEAPKTVKDITGTSPQSAGSVSGKRGRGRPKKGEGEIKVKRGRGRPRKIIKEIEFSESNRERALELSRENDDSEDGKLEEDVKNKIEKEEGEEEDVKFENEDEKVEMSQMRETESSPKGQGVKNIEGRRSSSRLNRRSDEVAPEAAPVSLDEMKAETEEKSGEEEVKSSAVENNDRRISILPMASASKDSIDENKGKADVIDLTEEEEEDDKKDVQSSSSFSPLMSQPELEKVLPPHVTDAMRHSGQKLKIVVRSPNVEAAKKIGELLRKTAMNLSSPTADVSVTMASMADPEIKLGGADTTGPGASSKTGSEDSQMAGDDTERQREAADVPDGKVSTSGNVSDGLKSKQQDRETPLVSRSESPDSISAAYDIQSDDFSSETSNDCYDAPQKNKDPAKIPDATNNNSIVVPPKVHTPAAPCIPTPNATIRANPLIPPAIPTSIPMSSSLTPAGSNSNNNNSVNDNESSDDDVIIGEAHGLQPPDPSLSSRRSILSHQQLGEMVGQQPSRTAHPFMAASLPTPIIGMASQSESIVPFSPPVTPTLANNVSPQSRAAAVQASALSSSPFIVSEIIPGRFVIQPAGPQASQPRPQEIAPQPSVLMQTPSGTLIQQQQQQQQQHQQQQQQNSPQPGMLFQAGGQAAIAATPQQSQPAANQLLLQHTSPPTVFLQQPASQHHHHHQQQPQQTLPVGSTLLPTGAQAGMSFLTLSNPPRLISPQLNLLSSALNIQSLPGIGANSPLVQPTVNAASLLPQSAVNVSVNPGQSLLSLIGAQPPLYVSDILQHQSQLQQQHQQQQQQLQQASPQQHHHPRLIPLSSSPIVAAPQPQHNVVSHSSFSPTAPLTLAPLPPTSSPSLTHPQLRHPHHQQQQQTLPQSPMQASHPIGQSPPGSHLTSSTTGLPQPSTVQLSQQHHRHQLQQQQQQQQQQQHYHHPPHSSPSLPAQSACVTSIPSSLHSSSSSPFISQESSHLASSALRQLVVSASRTSPSIVGASSVLTSRFSAQPNYSQSTSPSFSYPQPLRVNAGKSSTTSSIQQLQPKKFPPFQLGTTTAAVTTTITSQMLSSSTSSSSPSSSSQSQQQQPAVSLESTTTQLQKSPPLNAAPGKVNYMGSFELNSSSLQSLMTSQGEDSERSKSVMDLIKSALTSPKGKQIPGVEVRPVMTQTPQGPKRVLRVFIDEEYLKNTINSAAAAGDKPSLQLNPDQRGQQLSSTFNQIINTESQQQQQQVPVAEEDDYVHIPISHGGAGHFSKHNSRNFVKEGAQFRRPLKTSGQHTSQATKRKLASAIHSRPQGNIPAFSGLGLSPAEFGAPDAKRPSMKPVDSGDGTGTIRGSYQQVVTRVLHPDRETNPWHQLHSKADKHSALVSLLAATSTNSSSSSAASTSCSSLPPSSSSSSSSSSSLGIHGPAQPLFSSSASTSLLSSTHSLTSTMPMPQASHANFSGSQRPASHQVVGDKQQQPAQHHLPTQKKQTKSSPHKRASFPAMHLPEKVGQGQANQIDDGEAVVGKKQKRKQLMKKMRQKEKMDGQSGPVSSVREKKKKIAGPHRMKTSSSVSERAHSLIHHRKSGATLPQPSLEEEVVATPLDTYSGREHPNPNECEAKGQASASRESRLRFEITSEDGFSCRGKTMEDAWNQVIEKVKDVRAAARMKQLSYAAVSGKTMFGVDHEAVVYLVEQLYGAVHCHRNYKFKFHRYDLDRVNEEVPLNVSGAARSETFTNRKPYDMFNFLKSVYRTRPGDEERQMEEEMALKSARRATSMSLPMAMRFRKLKTFAKEAVDVYRSKIHGRGLFCKRNIDAGEMVIEYAGEVIRASLTDKREKYYESKGIGCYMFRIDDDEVIDATMHGSAARFINHSCEPNCFSKVIQVEGKKHIVIFAMRPIKRGEELTYDYKFPIEEVKIPCHCGSKRCRKYLN